MQRNSEQKPHELVDNVYRKNTSASYMKKILTNESIHTFSINLDKLPTERSVMEFEENDWPYLRLALVDVFLETKMND